MGENNLFIADEKNSVLLELVRSAVLNEEPVISDETIIDWDEIRGLASQQGLLAWVVDAMCKLPICKQPSRFQRISLQLSAQEIWNRYDKQKKVLLQMIEMCRQNGMRLLLLKGIGLSELYPKPASRPSGDIDVYFFDDYEKGNELFNQGDFVFGGKHAEFIFEGIHVENHVTMINTQTKKQRKIEQYIENGLGKVMESKDGYYTLPLMENLVYLLMHTLSHMNSSFTLPYRNIFDFALFIHRNRASISPKDCQDVMKRLRLDKSFELVLYLSEWMSGLSFGEYHLNNISKKDVDKAKWLVVGHIAKPDPSQSMLYVKQFIIRRKYDCQIHWLYKYLPKSPIERFRSSFHKEMAVLFRKMLHIPQAIPVSDFFHIRKSNR